MKDHTKWYTIVKEKFEKYKHIKNADKSTKQGASTLIDNQRINLLKIEQSIYKANHYTKDIQK